MDRPTHRLKGMVMSAQTLSARVSRPLAAAGVAAVVIVAGLLAPQAASARPTGGQPSYISCVSAPVSTLVREGSVAKKRGPSGAGFYTTGGGDYLGVDKHAIKSVAQTSPGFYRAVPACA